MSDNKNVVNPPEKGQLDISDTNIAVPSSEVSSIAGSVKTAKTHSRVSSSSERQIKFERAQKCLENAALVSKRIKEHRKATAELLGRPFEEDDGGDTASEMASTMSERTGYSAATDTSTTLSVQDALNIPGISESLANTLKQKELLMERIKQYKEISKRPIIKSTPTSKRESVKDIKVDLKKNIVGSDITQLQNTIKEKENTLRMMQVKMKAMETTILDFQEKINEKDQIIEAKNMATTLISDSLSKKEKGTMDLLEDTRQQMTKMQENFITMETEWKEEKRKLIKEIEAKDEKISSLEEANTILENSRFEISVAHSNLAEQLELKNKEIQDLLDKLEKMAHIETEQAVETEKEDIEEEKGAREIADMSELTKKIELLEQLNCQIRQTNKELENKLATNNESKSAAFSSPGKKGSPLPSRKNVRNSGPKKSPWSHLSSESLPEMEKKPNKNEITKLEMVIKSLNKDLLEKEYVISQKDAIISEFQLTNAQNLTTISNLQSAANLQKESDVDTVDVGICTAFTEFTPHNLQVKEQIDPVEGGLQSELTSSYVHELKAKLKAAEEQITELNNEIDGANKNMLKVKSSHKLKLKQMQKTIDSFSKVSDANAEIIKLNESLHQLSQKVAELEEEKGNLQLHLVDYDSGRLTESDVYKKMLEMEHLAETRLKAISVLEAQKFDLVQELHVLQQKNVEMEDKLADMSQLHTEQVCSEMNSVQLEEQIDHLIASKKDLELVIEDLQLDKEQLNRTINLLNEEKEEVNQKLEHYIQENIELTDKLEKLSAEKVSSAESIEIVESLTTQEKLELEEYNKGIMENKIDDHHIEHYKASDSHECSTNMEKLVEESAELNRKIELFSQERQEVMEKMNKISTENELLQERIFKLNDQYSNLQSNIDILNTEKHELQTLNEELNRQIEDLKRERIDIMKESVEMTKPVAIEDTTEIAVTETPLDDKATGDKGVLHRSKSVKQLTKEILKLKNTIKEREAEIADSQMKILSLEEQQQKQKELLHSNASYESKIKNLFDENNQLKEQLELSKKDQDIEHQLLQYKKTNDDLQIEVQRMQQEYSTTITTRDLRIQELESLLLEYEKQIFNYGNNLQQKDKEMAEYINQITKLNDVSQKLKSTIELLEEEKAKDQNAELVKSLNKQITMYQKKLNECEEKIRILEEEKVQLLSVKGALENKTAALDSELKKLQGTFSEKQNLIKELQAQQQNHGEEMSAVVLQAKERDEEIHEIKLQLRKESIENEKLRTTLSEKETNLENFTKEFDEAKDKLKKLILERDDINEQYLAFDTKNKELLEKLKKFAVNIKKKSLKNGELESQLSETQKQLDAKNEQLEQLSIQVEAVPALQEKLKYAEEEVNRLQSQKISLEQQRSNDVTHLQSLEAQLITAKDEISKLNDSLNGRYKELHLLREDNINLNAQIEALNKKLAEHEIEQKNNTNYVTKINSLEIDISHKQNNITELLSKVENLEQQLSQLHFGQDAKIQERDLFIESLEIEISKYKNRICRLEDSVSVMEDRRHSLERKADQLDSQLQEKQKAYTEYTSQEDELVNRLAALIDHDRVVEKQLHEIENDNRELLYKIQHLNEDNQRLRKCLSDIQEHCNTLVDKASKADAAEAEIATYQTQIHELENNLKRIALEHQTLLAQKKQDIEELESEFNTQIENAIKEKKALSEKYEKVGEHVTQLEVKLQEHRTNAQMLNAHLEDLARVNQELTEKSANTEQSHSPDYTEQYINEINKLNALLNCKNQEISEFNSKLQSLQTNNAVIISNLQSEIAELNEKLNKVSTEINQTANERNILKLHNEQLHTQLSQKEEQLKQLIDRKTVTFEMNIPKTEGMIISSTIEALSEEPKAADISSIESQIVTDLSPSHSESKDAFKKTPEHIQAIQTSGAVSEPVLVPKKAYLCYKGDENVMEEKEESDPFNSDEGWGLGECEDIGDVTPGLSHLNEQILKLNVQNEQLKADLHSSNTKLVKTLKKLKVMKNNNDVLSNEVKIARQISQSTFLDSAIEDELRSNIQTLEKKIEELKSDLGKEKREKESLKKQNEVFNNSNERLIEIKEKMDNEIELWKYKFKEANDKMSTLEWGVDSKDSPQHKVAMDQNVTDTRLKDEIMKLDKENDELQLTIDQLTSENKELHTRQALLQEEVNNLNKQLEYSQAACENCKSFNKQLLELQERNNELSKVIETLKEQLHDFENRYNEVKINNDQVNSLNEELQKMLNSNQESPKKCDKLEEEIQSLRLIESEDKNRISSLVSELESSKSKLLYFDEQHTANKSQPVDSFLLAEKYNAIEDHSLHLKQNLEDANNEIAILRAENKDLVQKCANYNEQINELDAKMQNLNTENDNLLSTVAELRSSVAGAVDQRGFEIAELWKQHLAQREADFQKAEHLLRTQLSESEVKYEQLLDNVQSSTQEETNKFVIMEQLNTLQNKLQDKEEHLRNLQDKYAEVINQLDILRSEMEDEKLMHENKLLVQQEEYEKQIQELTLKNQQLSNDYENSFKNVQSDLVITKSMNDELNQQIKELNNTLEETEAKVTEEFTNQLRIKDSEIYQKTHDYTLSLSQRNEEFENIRKQLIEYENKVEDLSYEKESELAILRLKMHEKGEAFETVQKEFETEKANLIEALNSKIIECTNLNKQIVDLNKVLEEHSNKTAEMQMALENQELEIVTLKDDLASLQQILRSSSNKVEKHVTFASDTKLDTERDRPEDTLNKELLDAIPRAELDLALYMLHQRDVRCEELTMELTQLLEERDTLQLRLSDSLRSYEELKAKCNVASLDTSVSSASQEAIADQPNTTSEKSSQRVDTHRAQTSRSRSISDPDGEKPQLQAKLSELRTVRHSRDVRLRNESEQRQLGMRLLQRDVANLPPEAMEQLTQAHHTLTRDSQSTPTVLLNWLRGKSTPKVVHM